ncbi:AMP-binding protein [Streptomyces sp. NA04227]|uniref:type I polyketide synthase n=1 Tax=Streptomyces sp. NA04227 TaxID=2742136 RepID=UPI001590691B|nr:type I polyketide synthase [Streptomyces sp. NA04227]QKW09063.1 AMP-binding protein [Streptomyces sp. NA04227]
METLVDLLRKRSEEQGRQTAFTFLSDGENVTERLSYADLDQRARAIAARLRTVGSPGDRVLMLYPSGPEFAAAFYGCLYAGMIAVPAYPPRSDKHAARLNAVAKDSGATVVAAPGWLCDMLSGKHYTEAHWVATDLVEAAEAEDWQPVDAAGSELAFLQYTSGSTGIPKGVMLSHANLLHNCTMMAHGMGHTERPVYVSWLPLFHDMGLIGNLLQALYWGTELVYMPPEAFLQEPIRWLKAISDYGGTFSTAPNFAYELCVRRTRPEDRAGLDLSSWKVALNAAEPIRAETLDRFASVYAEHGFAEGSWYPAYGLAENSVYVTGGTPGEGARVHHLDGAELERDRVVPVEPGTPGARSVVDCGRVHYDQKLLIVDPQTALPVSEGTIGEVWMSGHSAGRGYWQRDEETVATFHNRLAGQDAEDGTELPWVRTGDLGFLTADGGLGITGRIKDLIIVRGRNLYPQDIEKTVEGVDRLFRPGCTAAFSVELDGEERVVVAQEVRAEAESMDPAEVQRLGLAVASTLTKEFDVPLHALVLLRTRAVPKTSSGKIARRAAKKGYLDGTLNAVATWDRTAAVAADRDTAAGPPGQYEELLRQVLAAVADHLSLPADSIDPGTNFAAYGLDSAGAVSVSGVLQRALGRRLPAPLLYQHPTAEGVARHLAGIQEPAATRDNARTADEPVAVVGLACRFPGADNPEQFWELLLGGTDAIAEIPVERWGTELRYDPALGRPGSVSTRWGGYLREVAGFDPEFFGISPAEARAIDPQQRLLLEVAWEALEHASILPSSLAGSDTGVFVGISNNDYSRLTAGAPQALDAYYGTGNALSIAANRLSYLLDLRGPSLAVDTACSSSLVALHQACAALRSGESKVALAAGVNLILGSELTSVFSQAQMMAADGRCKAFDARADGYVRSEGCGAVVLKPLSLAQADGDRILAVIRGSAVNQDGRSNGLTAPHGQAQQEVIRSAWSAAGVAQDEIGYVEAHGTGTSLGDPIEYESLTSVLTEGRTGEAGPVCLGSVKTNIGHLESAAGIAGFIKTVLALGHGTIPPNLHLTALNPHIADLDSPLEIPTEARPWPRERRIAGVSAFGFGGTNAHVVLEAAPEPARADGTADADVPVVLPLSANSPASLRELAARYAELLARGELPLPEVGYAAGSTRTVFPHRLAVAAATAEDARGVLEKFAAEGKASAGRTHGGTAARAPRRAPATAFLFTGQGSHHAGMGMDLYRSWPAYREAFDACAQVAQQRLGFDLLEVVADEERLARTEFAQPAIFAVEYALAALWRSLGVEPTYLFGHSVGEYVAACLAGVFDLADALTLLGTRAKLMQELPPGGLMRAVRAPEAEVRPLVERRPGELAVAAVNGAQEIVLSGTAEAVTEAAEELAAKGHLSKEMRTSHAFHSPLMDPVLDEFRRAAEKVTMKAPQVPLVSSLTGRLAGPRMATAEYWVEQLRGTVRYADGVRTLLDEGCRTGLELGPDAMLAPLARKIAAGTEEPGDWVSSLRGGRPCGLVFAQALGAAWALGLPVDWSAVSGGGELPRAKGHLLPTYPFNRRRLWLPDELPRAAADFGGRDSGHPLLGRKLPQLAEDAERHVWQRVLARQQSEVLDDHRIQGQVVAPGTSYIEMALAAVRQLAPEQPYVLEDIEYLSVLGVPADGARIVQVGLYGKPGGTLAFSVHSRAESEGSGWLQHAAARLVRSGGAEGAGNRNGQHGEKGEKTP